MQSTQSKNTATCSVKPTMHKTSYMAHVKVVNKAIGLLSFVGAPITVLDKESILATAYRMEKSENVGSKDFLEPMALFLEICKGKPLTPLGRLIFRQLLLAGCRNRIKIERYIELYPSVEDIEIKRPIFVLGFPRTGTTAIQNMLCCDENMHGLEMWELQRPVPICPDITKDRKKRQKKTEKIVSASYLVSPEQHIIHEVKKDSYEECWPLFVNTFACLNFDLQSGMSEYGDWIYSHDMRGPYREYRRQLQMIAHHTGTKQFVLKCPEHLWFLDALLEVFPDACIVWTHRDPVASVASYSSLISMQWRNLYGKFDPKVVGDHTKKRFLEGVQRAMKAREAHGKEEQFYDIDFADFVRDQTGYLNRIKQHFGLPNDKETEGKMKDWLNQKRGDRKGAHKYSAEQHGIDAEKTRQEFAEYIRRFNVTL